jgi:hypothetical protein
MVITSCNKNLLSYTASKDIAVHLGTASNSIDIYHAMKKYAFDSIPDLIFLYTLSLSP